MKARFFSIITGTLIFTLGALFYVHQEVEIVKVGFSINNNRQKLTFLLDQHKSLIYNLSRLESPREIENKLYTNDITLCMPGAENVFQG